MYSRALIVEDLPAVTDWLRRVLERAFEGVQIDCAGSCRAARDLLASQRYPLALIDLGLPDGSGLELIALARASRPPTLAVVTTVFDDDEHLFAALRAGAQGYLLKDESQDELVEALRAIERGVPPLSPSIARAVLGYFSTPPTEASGEALTAREKEVLRAIASGHSVPATATALGLSHNTVATHLKRVYSKLSISSRAEASLAAERLGLLRPRAGLIR